MQRARSTAAAAALLLPAAAAVSAASAAEKLVGTYAYGAFALGNATADQHVHTDPDGMSNVEESWEFKADDGGPLRLQLQYDRGTEVISKTEATPYSVVRPEFYRIYRIEQATDVVRSTVTGTDRTRKFLFKAAGGKLSQLFDGSEQLISVTALPWYSRRVFLPEQFTQ
jgi:hypothetical protein